MSAFTEKATWVLPGYNQKTYLYLYQPAIVFQARVNQATTTYSADQVVFDTVTTGAYTDVNAGMLVTLGSTSGASDIGRHYVKAITSSTIYLGRFSRGVHDGELDITDNSYITVYEFYPVFAKIPFINSSGQIFLHGDSAFDADESIKPKANSGGPRIGFVDPVTNELEIDFDSNTSYSQVVPDTLDHLWDFVDGTPSSSALPTPGVVSFPIGKRHCSLTVTDANGTSQTMYFPVIALDPADTSSYIQNFDGTLISRDDGQELTLTIRQNIPESTYIDGTFCLLFKQEQYGVANAYIDGLAGPTNQRNLLFYGWHHSDTAEIAGTREGIRRNTSLTFLDVAGKLKTLPAFSWEIEYVVSPTTWRHMVVPTVDKYVYFLLAQFSSAAEVADFESSNTTTNYAFARLGSDGGSIWEQVAERAEAVGKLYKLVCTRYGGVVMRAYPLRQNTADRTSVSYMTLTGSDIARISYTHTRPPTIHWLYGEAIKAGSGLIPEALFSVAPGSTPGQGLSGQTLNQFLVSNQTALNNVTGHEYARLNATESEFTLEPTHNGDFYCDPSDLHWLTITLSAAEAAQRGLTFTSQRFLPTEISTDFNARTGQAIRTYKLFKETTGTPGQPVIAGVIQTTTAAPTPIFDGAPSGGNVTLAMFTANGYLATTTNFNKTSAQGSPTWITTALTIAGTALQFVEDAFSPLRVSGSGALNGWLVTTERIYSVADVFGTCTLTSRYTFAAADSRRSIDASAGTQNHVVCISHESGVTYADYSTNGTSFTRSTITSLTNSSPDGSLPGCVVSSRNAGYVYTTAYSTGGVGTAAERNGYRSTDYGATWVPWSAGVWSPRLTASGFSNDQLAGAFNIPFSNVSQNTAYYASHDYGTVIRLYRTNADQTTTNISPSISAVSYGPLSGRDKISISGNRMLIVGSNSTGSSIAIFSTTDRNSNSPTWTVEVAPNSAYYSVVFDTVGSGFFLFGVEAGIAYSNSLGTSYDSRKGSLNGVLMGTTIAIAKG